MTFQPIVPFGGFVGWQFLQRTMDSQRATFDAAPARQRDVDYFKDNIGSVRSPEDLVGDRRLRAVALGAFGLDADIDSVAFVRKVLEGGTSDPRSLANRLTDSRYREFAATFGFGNGVLPNTLQPGFGARIAEAYLERQFEIGVGASDPDLRLALNLQRELPQIAARTVTENTKWLTVMGNRPLREVFETAFGLPASFGTLDLDRQVETFKSRAERFLDVADFSDFADPERQEDLMRLFLARAQIEGAGLGAAARSPALTLLSNAARGSLFALT